MPKTISQVLPREAQECSHVVSREVADAFALCGLDMTETDIKKFHQQMKDLDIKVIKIINGPESGYHVMKNNILIKFIPASIAGGVVI